MSEYLEGFLTILPAYEKEQVEKIITENQDVYDIQAVNEDQFQQLLQILERGINKVTTLIKQGDKLDAESFNQFYSSVDVDLKRLYVQHLRTEKVVTNYNRILKGLLGDLYREVQVLRQKIEELDMRAKGEEGLLVIGYGFEEETRSEYTESNREDYINLFRDRDPLATILQDATLVRDYHQQYLMLPNTSQTNCMRNEDDKVTASIEILERRGVVVTDPTHTLDLAIDTGEGTYWAETIVLDAPMTKATMFKIKRDEV